MKKCKDIFEAIYANDVKAVKAFLPVQLELLDNMSGRTPLHYACIWGRIEVVKLLLDRGAVIEARDDFGWTPLYYVCIKGHTEITSLLLDFRAVIEARDNYDNTPLHSACLWGHEEIVRLLLDNGADIKAKDNKGCTPLHGACNRGHHKVSELLVSRGADPTVRNNDGETPLDLDDKTVQAKCGNQIPHKVILSNLYSNLHTIEASERTAALSSGWEMEL